MHLLQCRRREYRKVAGKRGLQGKDGKQQVLLGMVVLWLVLLTGVTFCLSACAAAQSGGSDGEQALVTDSQDARQAATGEGQAATDVDQAATGADQAATDAGQAGVAADHTVDQKLVVYTAHKEEVYRPIIEEFEQTSGIWVQVEAGGTTEMLRRIRQEAGENGAEEAGERETEEAGTAGTAGTWMAATGDTSLAADSLQTAAAGRSSLAADSPQVQADIMFGGGVENLETFKSFFAPYEPAKAQLLDPRFISADNSWTPFTELPVVFIYNNKLVSQEEAPRSWREFLDGTWTGQISFADPEKSGTSITILETLKLVNEEQGWYQDTQKGSGTMEDTERSLSDGTGGLLKAFATNLGGHMAAGSGQVLTEVASGDKMVGITLEETALKEIARGRDISMVYPQEGTSAVPDGVAILANAQNLENARKFIDFIIDDPVQKYVETNLYRRSVRTDIETGMPTIPADKATGTLQILDFDVTSTSQEERDVLETFLQFMKT